MYTLENDRCDIIGFDENGVFGFYRHSATQIVFKKYSEAVAFINYMESIGHRVNDIYIDEI